MKERKDEEKAKANGLVAFSVGHCPTDRGERQEVRGKHSLRANPSNPCCPCANIIIEG